MNRIALVRRSSAVLILLAVGLVSSCGGGSSAATTTTPSQAAAPTISPSGGSFSSAQSLTVSDSTPGAVFHCTADGSTPTASSAACPSTITVSPSSATVVVKVYVSASGYTDSATSTATFTYVAPPQATAPTINLATGTYTSCSNAHRHWLVRDNRPLHVGWQHANRVFRAVPKHQHSSTNGTTTVKAYATESGYTDSGVVSAVITINIPQAAAPSISPNGGSFGGPTNHYRQRLHVWRYLPLHNGRQHTNFSLWILPKHREPFVHFNHSYG
jgi:hypothetical protein